MSDRVQRPRFRLTARLGDLLIPAFPFDAAGGAAYVIYGAQKSAQVDGQFSCPLVEPLMRRAAGARPTYVSLGATPAPELMPSRQIPLQVNPFEFLLSLLTIRRRDLRDFRFIRSLYTEQLCFPRRVRWLQVLRTFVASQYFSLKFRELAATADAAYVCVYYNAAMLGVVKAFRRRGRPVFDVQHGFIGATHPAYENRVAFEMTTLMKPTGFVVWDERFGRFIEETLGMPWSSTDYLHVRDYAGERPALDSGSTRILYTLQWGTPLPDEVTAAVQRTPTTSWVFRMHPMEKDERADLAALRKLPNADIVTPEEPLPVALARSNLHVTYNSAAVHEAASLGIRSIFMDPTLVLRFAQELSSGMAIFSEARDLEKHLADALPGVLA